MVGCHVDITDRKRAEEALGSLNAELEQRVRARTAALAASEQFNRATLDALSAHVAVLDAQGKILHTNRAWKAFAEGNGLSWQSVDEGSNYLATCDNGAALGDPACMTAAREIRRVIAREVESSWFEYPCHAPGQHRWFSCGVTRFVADDDVHVVVAHRNVTDYRLAEQTLRESEERYRKLFETCADGILVLDLNGRICSANPAAADMHGYTLQELQTMRVHDLDTDPNALMNAERMRGLDTGETLTFEVNHRRKDGTTFPLDVSAVLMHIGSEPRILSCERDVTERKAAEAALRNAEQFAAIGRMAARVAHEINNPLAGISNSFQLIKGAIPEAHPHHAYVGRIEKEIARIARIVRQMLDLYRPEKESPAEFLLDEVLRDVVSFLEITAKSRGVRISIESADPQLRLFVQEAWLRQILFNLVQNAVDASQASSGEIRIQTRVDAERVCILVEDHGGGIAPEVLPRLFEPFFTTKRNPNRPGLGLGLSVSRNLALAMGGEIQVESQSGVGSKFRIFLPRATRGN
jgi:PAS domain S-box-containing protein